jgi:hypothetical protein
MSVSHRLAGIVAAVVLVDARMIVAAPAESCTVKVVIRCLM